LIKRTKQEKSRQNDRPPALLQGRNFRQSGQASLPKFQAFQHSHPTWPPRFVWPTHGAMNEVEGIQMLPQRSLQGFIGVLTIVNFRLFCKVCGAKYKFLMQTVCRSNEGGSPPLLLVVNIGGPSRSAFKPSVFFGYFL
jgi:hypothetical protein